MTKSQGSHLAMETTCSKISTRVTQYSVSRSKPTHVVLMHIIRRHCPSCGSNYPLVAASTTSFYALLYSVLYPASTCRVRRNLYSTRRRLKGRQCMQDATKVNVYEDSSNLQLPCVSGTTRHHNAHHIVCTTLHTDNNQRIIALS